MASFEFIVARGGNQFMLDIANLYSQALRELGHESVVQEDVLPSSDVEHSIVVAPQEYVPLFLDETFGMKAGHERKWSPEARAALEGSLLLCVDQPGSYFFNLARETARHAAGVLDISPFATSYWNKIGVPAVHWPLPFGQFAPSSGPRLSERPVDVLFLGVDSPRRLEFFSANAEKFEPFETRWMFQRHAEPLVKGTAGALFGEERTALLHSAKVIINVHATKRSYFEWHRAMLAIAHGCVYVTETSQGSAPLQASKDFEEGPLHELADRCVRLFESPEGMQAMADRAHQVLHSHLDHHRCWPEVLEGITARRRPANGSLSTGGGVAAQGENGSTTVSSNGSAHPAKVQASPPMEACSTTGVRLVRRAGFDRDGRFLVASDSRCTLAMKPPKDSTSRVWSGGPQRVTIQFDVPLENQFVRVVAKEWFCGARVSFALEVPVSKEGQVSFPLDFDGLIDCAIKLEVPRGTRFPVPSVRLSGADASDVHRMLKRRTDKQFDQLGWSMQQLSLSVSNKVAFRNRITSNRLFDKQTRALGGQTSTVERNFDPTTSAAPAVSVIIPLHNYRHYVMEAIASVERSAVAVPDLPIEIVVVDDASTDDGGDLVRGHFGRCKVPISLVTRLFNLGLAEARNLGIRQARGERLFFLDADNVVMPKGLSRLAQAMDREGASAAYGILAVFVDRGRPTDASLRDSLLSFYPWSKRHLLMGNYIDAMAMFRRKDMIELGCYDPSFGDLGAPGWEDYDLWLRMLSRGIRPAFLPTVVGKYRRHGNSMSDEFNDNSLVLGRVFGSRYGHLIGKENLTHRFGYAVNG